MARRPRTPKPITAPALPFDPPPWTLPLLAFQRRLGDLTLVKLQLSPFGTNTFECYLVAGDIACEGMRYPLHVTVDESERHSFEPLPWAAGLPDEESTRNFEETNRRRSAAGKAALAEASQRFTLYPPYVGRPVKETLTEAVRGAPTLSQWFAEGKGVRWHAEHAWQSMVARAIKAGEPVPEANRAHVWQHASYLLEAPQGQRPSQRLKAGPPEPLTPMPRPGEIRFVGMDQTLAALAEATNGAETVEYLGVQMNRGPWVREFRRVRMPHTSEAIRQLLTDYEGIVARWNREHPRAAPDATGRPLNWCISEARWLQDFEAGGWVKILTRREPTEATRSRASAEARAISERVEAAPSPPPADIPPAPRAHAKPTGGSGQLSLFDLS